MRPLKFTFLLLLFVPTLLAASFTPAMAARRDSLVVRGHVFDSLGVAIRESWVITQGSRRIDTLVEPSGAYVLVIPVASTEELIRSPLELRVQARHKGWRIALASGATELGIELRVVRGVDGIARLEVRSNDPDVAATIANTAVLESSLRAEVWAEFKGTRGDQVDGGTEEMTAYQEVQIAGERDSIRYERIRARDVPPWVVSDLTAAATASKDSAANVVESPASASRPTQPISKSSKKAKQEQDRPIVFRPALDEKGSSAAAAQVYHPSAASRPSPEPQKAISAPSSAPVNPPPASASMYTRPFTEESESVKPAARPSPVDSCTCRIHGTVEVERDRPLPEKTPVTVSIEGQPKLKDVAELFMGSPRDFDLARVPCGMLRLKVDSRSKLRLGLVTDPVIDCTGGGYRQIRLVLVPNKGH